MTKAHIDIEGLGAIRRIWLNRPDKGNAQTLQMMIDLDAALTAAEDDDSVRVIVIAGRGRNFCAGHDLKEFETDRADFTVEQRRAYELRHYLEKSLRLWDCKKPTISQVQGACIAGGHMLANMTDLIVASEDAYFWDSATHAMGVASTELLFEPWVMGLRHAKEFLFTNERITAAEAYRIGMINRVVPLDVLSETTLTLAGKIAAAPPFAIQTLKASLNRTADIQGFRNAILAHFDVHQLSHASGAFEESRSSGLHRVVARNKET